MVANRAWPWGWFVLLGLLVPTADAWACRCAPLSLADFFRRADVVAEVEITAVETRADDERLRASLDLINNYKNAAGLRAMNTASDGAQCGLQLHTGQRYWIFGSLVPGTAEVTTGLCDGSRDLGQSFADTSLDETAGALAELASGVACATPTALQIAQRLQLTEVPADGALGDAVPSPNGAYSLALSSPSAVQRPPRVTRLWLDRERDTRLELALHGATDGVHAEWINEKLVLVQAPWSRQMRSDLVLDVESGELVMTETARLDDAGVLHWVDARCRDQP